MLRSSNHWDYGIKDRILRSFVQSLAESVGEFSKENKPGLSAHRCQIHQGTEKPGR